MKQPICSRCKHPLSDPVSIAIGMGPECRGALSRKGWKFPKPRWKVQGGRPVLMGLIGKIEQPPIGDTSTSSVRRLNKERKEHNAGNEHES